MPLSQNRASENKFEEPLSSIGAPELKTVLLSLDGAPEYCHNHKKPPQIENTPEVCTAGSRVLITIVYGLKQILDFFYHF